MIIKCIAVYSWVQSQLSLIHFLILSWCINLGFSTEVICTVVIVVELHS